MSSMSIPTSVIRDKAIKDRVIVIKVKRVEYPACKICGMEVSTNYRVNDSWRGWVISCPNCGIVKEYDN